MSQTTIQALAKELNLSISTVSKALNDSHEISPETKERVLQMARLLHYKPNPYASSLRHKKSSTIAVVIPDIADGFFSQAIRGIEEIARYKGYHVLIYLTYESVAKEKQVLEEIQNGRADGVLISVSAETRSGEHIEALQSTGLPLVLFDRTIEGTSFAKVRTDDSESGYKAARHLIEKGCRRIAFLSISSDLDINIHRLNGYKAALTSEGFSFSEELVVSCSNDLEENIAIFRELLLSKPRPDAVIASVEKLILPFYLSCKRHNIAIPSQMKIVAFSNLAIAEILAPSLTTITQPAFEIGKAAAAILFKALEKPNYLWQKEAIVIPSELVIRESTGGK